ncbi:MAG: TolC family protein [Methylobacillus sp.]|jgi:outer membrane protein TolC|nr:TolC family protein [Methylobacillus sp.]
MILACLATACAHQTYEPAPIDPGQTAERFTARTLDAPELRRYMESQGYAESAFPLQTWGLRELTLAAFHYHPDLELARAQWRAAQAQEITAGQKPNPGFSTQVEHHSETDGGISPWSLMLAIDIPIETAGKRQFRIDQAVHLSEASRLAIGQRAWEIYGSVRSALIDYRAAARSLELLEQELALQQAIVEMLQKRLESGYISDIDLASARLRQQHLQNNAMAARTLLAESRARLAIAVGIPATALNAVTLDESLPALQNFTEPPPDETQRVALLNRLDIRAALARYAAAESRLQLEIARQQPDFVLSPGYMFDQGDNIWLLGFSTLLNLMHHNEGPIAEAEAQRAVAAREFEALQARVIGEQDLALAQYESRLAELEKAGAMLETQRQNVSRSERQFETGYIDRLQWTTTKMEALAAEQGRLAASVLAEKARAALEDALQRPLDDSVHLALPDQNSEESSP